MDLNAIKEIAQLLAHPLDVVITSHRNPDGDAIGSSWALAVYLKQMGHQVKVIYPSDYPQQLDWMPSISESLIFDTHTESATYAIEKADLIYLLDYNDLARVDKMGEVMEKAKAKRIMIDHHLFPENCADWVFSDTTASSTCELIFDFLMALGNPKLLNLEVCEHIFTGIVTDTGSFRHATSPKLFRTVATLLELGVRDVLLQNLINNSMSEKQLRLVGHCLHNCLEFLPEYKTAIISLSKRDYEAFDIQRGDTEGIVNYMLMLREVTMAVFIMEQPNIVKLSFRSKGDFSVQEICRQHFKGGGHKNASGGATYSSLRQTLDKVKSLLPQYKDALLAEQPSF